MSRVAADESAMMQQHTGPGGLSRASSITSDSTASSAHAPTGLFSPSITYSLLQLEEEKTKRANQRAEELTRHTEKTPALAIAPRPFEPDLGMHQERLGLPSASLTPVGMDRTAQTHAQKSPTK
jgi:hypothetical protein